MGLSGCLRFALHFLWYALFGTFFPCICSRSVDVAWHGGIAGGVGGRTIWSRAGLGWIMVGDGHGFGGSWPMRYERRCYDNATNSMRCVTGALMCLWMLVVHSSWQSSVVSYLLLSTLFTKLVTFLVFHKRYRLTFLLSCCVALLLATRLNGYILTVSGTSSVTFRISVPLYIALELHPRLIVSISSKTWPRETISYHFQCFNVLELHSGVNTSYNP